MRICEIPKCSEKHVAQGYCKKHYREKRKSGEIDSLNYIPPTQCSIENCKHGGVTNGKGIVSFPKGFCSIHYRRWKRSGDPHFMQIAMNEGRKKDPLYMTYKCMKSRCYSISNPNYDNWGGRGIKVCQHWLGLEGFPNWKNDMGERPSSRYSIDRIDNDMNYSCGHCSECVAEGWEANCRWATKNEQAVNRRDNNKTPGVYWDKSSCRGKGRWVARLQINKKEVLHKTYHTYEDAVTARKEAEFKYLGYYINEYI